MDDVPVQFYQSILAIELGVSGALLFQIRFFAPQRPSERGDDGSLPDPRLRLLVAVVIGATVFGTLDAMLNERGRDVAAALLLGVGLSLLPILLRALPPFRDPGPGSSVAVTVLGLVLYAVVVAVVVVLVSK